MGCQMRAQLAEVPPRPGLADSAFGLPFKAEMPRGAVALTDLYLRGDGVPAYRDQARVLLLVASEKRNARAIEELQELDKTGWPAPSP